MQCNKIRAFMALGGQTQAESYREGSDDERKLGARLLLSEVLEYVIKGLGVTPVVNGQPIEDPDALHYSTNGVKQNHLEMLDGLADVAYTMYWNSCAFGLKLEEAFDLVCDNNLDKFVKLENWTEATGKLPHGKWNCGKGVSWPESVATVEVIKLNGCHYAVGKDAAGKVRKPSSYQPVNLSPLTE